MEYIKKLQDLKSKDILDTARKSSNKGIMISATIHGNG